MPELSQQGPTQKLIYKGIVSSSPCGFFSCWTPTEFGTIPEEAPT